MPVEPDEVEYGPWNGTDGNDVHYDTNIRNIFYGNDGDDVFYVSANDPDGHEPFGAGYYPDDFYFGGDGNDTISYQQSTLKIVADLNTGIINRKESGPLQGQYSVQSADWVFDIENLIGTNFDDVILGSDGANVLNGLGGNDVIDGRGGDDQIWGGSGNDTLNGGDGNDIVDGGSGNDSMVGGSGHDTLAGGSGNDSILGGSGNDRLDGGSGNDVIDGGSGTDTVVYNTDGDVNVHLWSGEVSGAAGNDTLISIERVETGGGNDVVYATDGSNVINVGAGNDTVLAFGGNDIVYAGSGNDMVWGYEGIDVIFGGAGNDTVWGGADADTISGEDGDDALKGDAGDDFLFGGNGADRIRGGDGDDTIAGGSGSDVIEWLAGDGGWDTIVGFTPGEDRLFFGNGFFAVEPTGNVDLEDVLMVYHSGDDALLIANTAESGWSIIATFQDFSASLLDAMIENETILGPVPIAQIGGGTGGTGGYDWYL